MAVRPITYTLRAHAMWFLAVVAATMLCATHAAMAASTAPHSIGAQSRPQVSMRCGNTLELKADGTVWAAGSSAFGQLGNGATAGSASTPVQVRLAPAGASPLTNVIDIAQGCDHAVALLADGSVYSWGRDDRGQLASTATATCSATACSPWASQSDASRLSRITSIAAGAGFTMALDDTGHVWTWGDNTTGQAGQASAGAFSATAQRVRDPAGTGVLGNVRNIAAGDTFALANTADGLVWSWGLNADGQLGSNGSSSTIYTTPQNVLTAGAVPLTNVKEIAAGRAHALALLADGSIAAWGRNSSGQLGIASTTSASSATLVTNGTSTVFGFKAIAAGGAHSLAVKSDGTAWAWGDNSKGQLAQNTYVGAGCAATCSTTPQAIRDSGGAVITTATAMFRTVAAGASTSGALRADGTLMTWGRNDAGELGTVVASSCPSSEACSPFPVVSGFTNVLRWSAAVQGGGSQLALLRSDGTVWTAGANNRGALGIGNSGAVTASSGATSSPVQALTAAATPITNAIGINMGSNYLLVLRADGTVWASGINLDGELGNGTFANGTGYLTRVQTTTTPTYLTGITQVVASSLTAFALDDAGQVWSWGESGQFGTLGRGTSTNSNLAAPVQTGPGPTLLGNVIAVTAQDTSGDNGAAITADGAVWGWGDNQANQLAQGTNTGPAACLSGSCSLYAVQARASASTFLFNVVEVVVGNNFQLATRADGVTGGWGDNALSQLASKPGATTEPYFTAATADPLYTSAAPPGKRLGAGDDTSFSVDATGRLWSWGDNTAGTLGLNTFASPLRFARTVFDTDGVTPMSNVVSVDAGGDDAVALLADGSVRTWGLNDFGQASDCTTTYASLPVAVAQQDTCAGNRPPNTLRSPGQQNGAGANVAYGGWMNTTTAKITFGASDPDNNSVVTAWYEVQPVTSPLVGTCGGAGTTAGQVSASQALGKGQNLVSTFSVDQTGAALANGTMYHWRACVRDAGGLSGPVATVDPGFGVDTSSPPAPIVVSDGTRTGIDSATANSLQAITANWDPVVDLPVGAGLQSSGIARYDYCVSTFATGTDCASTAVRAWTTNGAATALNATGLSLTQGATYFVCVRAVDVAGNLPSAATCSDGQTVTFSFGSVAPASQLRATTSTVTITGTGFQANDVVSFSKAAGAGVTSVAQHYLSPTRLDVTVTATSSATLGAWNITVTHAAPDASSVVGTGVFTVNPNPAAPGNRQVATGCDDTAVLKTDGTVWTSGSNDYGQLGNGGLSGSAATPVQVQTSAGTALTGVRSIAVGCSHMLALRSDGTVWAWGRADLGQLGAAGGTTCTATSCAPYAQQAAGLANVLEIAAGTDFSLALLTNGNVWSFGDDGAGQLGNNVATGSFQAAQHVRDSTGAAFLTNIKAIAAGGSFALALDTTGKVWAWGSNSDQQLGANLTLGSTYPLPRRVQSSAGTSLTNVKAVAAGAAHGLALLADGSLKAWGRNSSGQLGTNGTAMAAYASSVVDAGGVTQTGFKAIVGGGAHSVGLKADGSVWTWGLDSSGQLGDNAFAGAACAATCQTTPQQLRDSSGALLGGAYLWRQVAAGASHTAVIRSDGIVWTWGRNQLGQLGAAPPTACPNADPCSRNPIASAFGTGGGNLEISAGFEFAVSLHPDGTAWGWGDNQSGELANGYSGGAVPSPTQLLTAPGTPITDVIAVSASEFQTYLLRGDGTVWAVGNNYTSALGNNGSSGIVVYLVPVRSGVSGSPNTGPLLTGIVDLHSAGQIGMALASDGRPWNWGSGSGQGMGIGTVANMKYATPQLLVGGANVTNVVSTGADSAAGDNGFNLLADGTVTGWGENTGGQAGLLTNGPETCGTWGCSVWNRPVVTSSGSVLGNVRQVQTENNTGDVVLGDGSVWTWGSNVGRALGTNLTSTGSQYGAVPVRSSLSASANGGTALANVRSLGAGNIHGAVVDGVGQLLTWGENQDGVIGDGTTTNRGYAAAANTASATPLTGVISTIGGSAYQLALRDDGTIWGAGRSSSYVLGSCSTVSQKWYVPVGTACSSVNQPPMVAQLLVKANDNVTPVSTGAWTFDGASTNLYVSFSYSDPDDGQTITPYFEFVPLATPFSSKACGDMSNPNLVAGTAATLRTGEGRTFSITKTGLAAGGQYQWRACAVDSAGGVSDWYAPITAGTRAFGVDPIAPNAPTAVSDGPVGALDMPSTSSLTHIDATWTGGADAESGLRSFDVCVSTSSAGADCATTAVSGWTNNGTSRKVSVAGLTLTSGTTYYVCVRTTDQVPNYSAATCSDGQTASFDVTSVAPAAIVQGRRSVVVQVLGAGLRANDQVSFAASPDVTILSQALVSSGELDVTVDVSSSGVPGARAVTVTHPVDGTTRTVAAALTVVAPSMTLSLSTLGVADAARTTTGPRTVNFGTVLPGSAATVGPAGSGQALPGSAIDLTVISDTDWRSTVASNDFTSGPDTLPASALAWRHHAPIDAWSTLPAGGAPGPFDGADLPMGVTGGAGTTIGYDLQLTIPAAQPPGTYSTSMTFTVLPVV